MLEYKGFEVKQTEHSIYLYQNGRFVLHASVTARMDEEELYQTLDFLIANCTDYGKQYSN